MSFTSMVNGTAVITDDHDLCESFRMQDKVPATVIVVTTQSVYTQCPKAFLRSELWNPERHIDRSELPSQGEILRAIADPELDVEQYDEARNGRYRRREGFY